MKLLVAVVAREDVSPLIDAFVEEHLPATVIEARGGILHEGVAAILAGLDERQLRRAMVLLDTHCRRRTTMLPTELPGGIPEWGLADLLPVETGGATVFVLPVVRHERA